ncbi:hypothetical protein [Promineifilum sp.]|uniref:hypothetical protein n=1 Tax=Promineifilum sp. TaxID=2664178 RepID=UPI0035AFB77B
MPLLSPTDWLVFILVVGLRFLLPLLIPFFPLPAIVACLLLDGVDQTIFQVFTNLPLDGYQSYDKALDIYYLSVAYIATFRNWTNDYAFQVSRFLYYYRLVGVVLFELLGLRALLLIFPNTFEYFFIWYEAVRLWWEPRRLSRRTILIAAAAIWIVIKLPQEWWIHIAQRDVTDTIKALLGGTPESPWGPLLAENWLLIAAALLIIGAAIFFLYRTLRTRLPRPEHPMALSADAYTEQPAPARFDDARAHVYERVFDRYLFEKVALLSLLTIIFSEMLPTSTMRPLNVVINVAAFIIANTAITTLLARRGTRVASGIVHFAVVLVVNFGLVLLRGLLLGGATNWLNATVFIFLLSVTVTLFDRFVLFRLARFPGMAH